MTVCFRHTCCRPNMAAILISCASRIILGRDELAQSHDQSGETMKQNYIAGKWVDGATVSRNVNPSDLSDVIGEFAQADVKQTGEAVAAAAAAVPVWAATTAQAKFDALDKIGSEILARAKELGELLAREEGKTLPEGVGEVTRAG